MFDDIIIQKKKLNGKECPHCRSEDIEKDGEAKITQYGWIVSRTDQSMKCNSCSKNWILVYDWTHKLVDIIIAQGGENV